MQRMQEAVAQRYHVGDIALGRQLGFMLTFNLLLIASSYISMPLPFSPVPVTAQTMAVLSCGLFLGPIYGALTVLAYLAEGAIGLPVFSGGAAGLARIVGPTGGYLVGFVAAAFVVGHLSEKAHTMTYGRLLAVLSVGTACILVPGVMVVSLFAPEGSALAMGLYPFLPGAAIKVVILASGLSAYKKIRRSL